MGRAKNKIELFDFLIFFRTFPHFHFTEHFFEFSKQNHPKLLTKSGFMVGLEETKYD